MHLPNRSLSLSLSRRLLARQSPTGVSCNMLAREYIGYSWVWCLQRRSHNSPVNSLGLLHLQGHAGDIMWESRPKTRLFFVPNDSYVRKKRKGGGGRKRESRWTDYSSFLKQKSRRCHETRKGRCVCLLLLRMSGSWVVQPIYLFPSSCFPPSSHWRFIIFKRITALA